MDKTQAAPYRSQLLDLRQALLAQIADERGGVFSRAEVAAERFGRPEDPPEDEAAQRDLAFTLCERETAELEVIDAALHRIDMGTYGDCADCGEPIGLARLNASPDVPRCMDCQTQREHHRLG